MGFQKKKRISDAAIACLSIEAIPFQTWNSARRCLKVSLSEKTYPLLLLPLIIEPKLLSGAPILPSFVIPLVILETYRVERSEQRLGGGLKRMQDGKLR